MNKITLVSLTYNCKGHSKNYINSLVHFVKDKLDLSLYVYGKPTDKLNVPIDYYDGNAAKLDYEYKKKFSSQKKIIRRFIASVFFYINLCRLLKGNEKIYFMDYEYISLLIFMMLFRKHDKVIWIHSASTGKKWGFYKFYKSFFFRMIRLLNADKTSFVVNGDYTKSALKEVLPGFSINVVQYPTDFNSTPIEKNIAKQKLGLDSKFIFSTIGMIRSDKRYDILFDVFSKSKYANDDSCALLIAGELSSLDECYFYNLINKYNLNNVVFKFKYFDTDELNELFSATDVMLVTYGNEGSSQSGPLSLCRNYLIPSIVFDGGEIGFYVAENKVGLVAKDFNAYVHCINSIFDQISLLQLYLKEAQVRYGWRNISNCLVKVLS